ncbi:MAG: class I SAM-dependent methyltransferase [bacterium]|nr:class I SAM-dependent methyltransferase [bacterium]
MCAEIDPVRRPDEVPCARRRPAWGALLLEDYRLIKRQFLGLSCPVCGSYRIRDHGRSYHYTYARCDVCAMVFAKDIPTRRRLHDRYVEGYIEQRRAFFGCADGRTWDDAWENDRNEIFDRFLPGFEAVAGPGRRALEVGCAEGRQIELLARRGWEVVGVEIGADMVREGRARGLRILQGMIEDFWFPCKTFHLIVMSHVIEHLADPLRVLRMLRRMAGPGGLIIIETPLLHDFGDRDHFHFFTEATLQAILDRAGFIWSDHFVREYRRSGVPHKNVIACARRR